MVRVPGSSGDSGFQCESLSEEVKIKPESGIEAPAKEASSQMCEDEGSQDRPSCGRGFKAKKSKEEDRSHNLEENTQTPRAVSSGATSDCAAKHDLQDESPRGILKSFSFISDEPS